MARPLRQIESSWTSTVKPYSNSTIDCLERFYSADETSSRIYGRSSRSGKWAWLVRGSALEVVDTANGQRLSAWRFGWSTAKKLPYSISCVEELPTVNGLYLVVGLRSTGASSQGMVCLFDPIASRVVKAIKVPRAVTAIECLTTGGGADAPQHAISKQLQLMFGLVAVGMECGHVYLVDLRLDDDVEEFDEWNPSHLQIIDPENGNIAKQRGTARSDGAHCAFELGAECHMLGSFSYASPEGEILANLSSSEISITSLKYVRQLGSLVVGYSFGCFQIWDLEQHSREFSSCVGVHSLPVTHIVYQEPENDPRLCCYLWIARAQPTTEEIIESPTTITLYQLTYERKENLPGYGRILKDFSGCGGRFEHQLTGDPYHLADATTCGSKVLCFYTLERDDAAIDVTRLDDSSDDFLMRDLTLVACVWEAPAAELHSSPTCHLAVFDINRWYHSQMPASIRDAMYGSKDPTCPFFSVYSLAEILHAGNPDALVDVLLKPNEIGRFSSAYGAQPEQFFWASSLTFDVICLMETGIVQANFQGTQQQVLGDLNQKGVTALNEAHEYFHRCWTATLMPKNFDFSRAQEKTFQIEAVLSVALEHNQPSFIISCINKLGEENITYAGCNLRIILEWAWDQVIQIKQHLDQLCIPLFDGTGIFVDKQLIAILDHYGVQLGNLVDIFQALSSAAPTTEQGIMELESQYTVTYLLHQYLQVVLFFMKQRLLPELFDNNEDGELSSQYFPGEALAQQYDVRRRELERLNIDSLGSLMIDRVVSMVTSDLGHKLWETENRWSELYPPPNLHAVSSLLLQEKINPTSKLCIVYYSLLDLCSLNPQFRAKKVAEKFAATFGLQPLLTKLFHGFWFLDHRDFENALQLLTECASELEIAPWQNAHIIRLFLNQEQAKEAMLFIRSVKPAMDSPEDVQLHLSVLISNGLVTEAFKFQRECRDPVRREQLLEHFFHGCHQTKNTNKILELPLNKVEEEHLVKFLEESPFPHARELLVMFYLQRGFYVQAIRLNEQLKRDLMSARDPAAQQRASVRNVIVGKYFELLPKVQQELALRPDKSLRRKTTEHREVPRPKPLSTVVNYKVHPRPMSQAAVLNAALEKIAETRTNGEESPKDAPFTGTPSAQRTKSLLSDSHLISFPRSNQKEQPAVEAKVRTFQVPSKQSSILSPMSPLLRRERARKLFRGANALSLLQTPPVTKHLSFAATPNPQNQARPTARHSILKPTKITRRSPSPSLISPSLPPRIRRISGDRVPWMETGSDNEDLDNTQQKKQIRFESPSPSVSNATDAFSFTGESPKAHATLATVDRIPEEDIMETEVVSLEERSSDSGREYGNELEVQPSTSDVSVRLNVTVEKDKGQVVVTEDDKKDVEVIAVDMNDQEVQPSTSEIPRGDDDEEGEMNKDDSGDVEVVAVVDLDEDVESEIVNQAEQRKVAVALDAGSTGHNNDVVRPSVVDPRMFMNRSFADGGETTSESHPRTIPRDISPPTTTSTPPQPSVARDTLPTTSSAPKPTLESPPRFPEVPPSRTSPERTYMPLRDKTPDRFQPPSVTVEPPPENSTQHFDPGASTSKDRLEPTGSPGLPSVRSTSSRTPSDGTRMRNSPPDARTQSPEVLGATRVSPSGSRVSPSLDAASSPPRLGAEALPMSGSEMTVSTMTPPMSPPRMATHGTSVSPRIFLDDINSPHMVTRSHVTTPNQSERRLSRSPSRQTPTRTSPPLTRSARRRSSRNNTPHQSPTDSPISFVTPMRKSGTSPRRKSPSQKKLVKLASHGMTLRARSCTNKTTRCAKLPHTQ